MAGLNELKVSLTKNGYFKVAEVIKRHPRNEVLDKIWGTYPDINLNRAQIASMLSADAATGELPEEWDEIRSYKGRDIEAFTFLSILYSHVTLIKRFAKSTTSEMRGVLERQDLGEKVYTNLVYSMQSIGLCQGQRGSDSMPYNLAPLFQEMSIGPLFKKILRRKLEKTGWEEPQSDDFFTRSFYEQCFFYRFHKTLGMSERQFCDWLEGRAVQIKAPPTVAIGNSNVSVSASLLAALAAKPFAIIAGTTGTGKTMTVRHCIRVLCPSGVTPTFNNVFIPVEAGWNDGRHLLGYKNPFGKKGENYATTPLISLLLRANHHAYADVPFFIVLDEMNLSYVEMYFSRFLSLMETASGGNPEPVLGPSELYLMLRSSDSSAIEATYIDQALNAGGVYLTKNVHIVGTVNVDETTHMFSPKVLDRAFVLEFPPDLPSQKTDTFTIPPHDTLLAKASEICSYLTASDSIIPSKKFDSFLDAVYQLLGKFKFGPRVTNEVQRYIAAVENLGSLGGCTSQFLEEQNVKDRVLMQKILPKLHGNRSQLSKIIDALIMLAKSEKLPQTGIKLEAMKNDLVSPGFTNFFA